MQSKPNTPINTPPKPETKRAFLISAGLQRPMATVHHYLETRLTTLSGPGGGAAWEYIFKCFKTGAERRWGVTYGPDDDAMDAFNEAAESEGN